MKGLSIIAIAALATSGAAHAAGVGLRAGTTGIGADVAWGIAPTLSARVGYSGLSWNTHLSETSVRYDAKLKLSNANALLDFSPFGPFRLTGGFIANSNKYDLTGPSGSFTVNGNAYSSGNLSGTVKSGKSVAPYLGVGYGNVWTKGVNFYFDLGIMFQGTPKVDLNVNCGSATPAQCTQAQNELAAERQRVQDELDRFKYYPVLNLGITVGF
jgi:hypothetical protein